MCSYQYKVVFDIKHVNKKSVLCGMLTPEVCKFGNIQSAMRFIRSIKNRRTTKYHVIGMPILERI